MSKNRLQDEAVLIDLLLGQCDAARQREVEQRLAADPEFAKLKEDLENAFGALRLMPEAQAPDDLVKKTLARVESAKQTDAILSKVEASRRWAAPTFSLREVGAMAAAVLILAVVFIPSIRQAKRQMVVTECASNMGQIGSALSSYATDDKEFFPASADHKIRWMPADGEKAVSNSAGLFKLVKGGYAAPGVFQCPAVSGEPLAVAPSLTDFPAAKYVSYSYQHPVGPDGALRRDSLTGPEADRMVLLADNTPVFPDGTFRRDRVNAAASENHNRTGQNVLYANMSVSWADRPNVGVSDNNIFLADGVYDYHGDEAPASRTDTFLLPAYSGK